MVNVIKRTFNTFHNSLTFEISLKKVNQGLREEFKNIILKD